MTFASIGCSRFSDPVSEIGEYQLTPKMEGVYIAGSGGAVNN